MKSPIMCWMRQMARVKKVECIVSIEARNEVPSTEVDRFRAPALEADRSYMSSTLSIRGNHLMRMVVFILIAATPLFLVSSARAQIALNACDLNQDCTVNVVDGQLAVDMFLGLTPCTANVVGAGICTTDVVNRVIAAALGGTCVIVVPPAHSVTLNWVASVSGNINGYNVYRSATSGGPYAKLTSSLVTGTTYTDSAVVAGQTYYYVATAVDISNNESAFSTQAQAVVPTP
jgi:hypothetical protein